MSEVKDVFLGFDPGGERRRGFGWSICHEEAETRKLIVHKACLGINAREVFDRVKGELESEGWQDKVRSAGIDAPLFWNKNGEDRNVDGIIRRELRIKGKNPRRVVSVNGLYGSVLAQGVLIANLLHQEFKIPITEAHPTALEDLDKSMKGSINCLPRTEKLLGLKVSRDRRDAAIAAYAAWRMYQKEVGPYDVLPKWRDLFPEETARFCPLQIRVSYWMPISK